MKTSWKAFAILIAIAMIAFGCEKDEFSPVREDRTTEVDFRDRVTVEPEVITAQDLLDQLGQKVDNLLLRRQLPTDVGREIKSYLAGADSKLDLQDKSGAAASLFALKSYLGGQFGQGRITEPVYNDLTADVQAVIDLLG